MELGLFVLEATSAFKEGERADRSPREERRDGHTRREHLYGKYDTDPGLVRLYVTDEDGNSFNSMQRLKLLSNAINAEAPRLKRVASTPRRRRG